MTVRSHRNEKRYPLAFALTVLLFAIWGGAHRVFGIVSPQFEKFFAYSHLQSSIVFLSLNLSYFVIAVPVALFLRRYGYKLGLVSGLGAFALGALLLYPAVVQHAAAYHSAAIVVTGIGWAFLEVSANALIVRMGPVETAVRRLNLAQCFYPAGLIAVMLFGRHLTLPPHDATYGALVNDVVRPYIMVGLGVLLLAIIIENVEFPNIAGERTPRAFNTLADIKALWADPKFRNGQAALAAFTTGLVCLWGCSTSYAQHVLTVTPAAGWMVVSMATWGLCFAGRVVGTGMMVRIDPMRLLAAFAALAIVLCAVPAFGDSVFALGCMIAASFFISIMFPTIFAETIKDLGPRTKLGAGFLVAGSGLGGFIGMMAQRVLSGYPGFVHVSLLVAGLCFSLVLLFAVASTARRTADVPAPAQGAPAARS